MENPQALAGAHIESARIALVIAHAFRCHALAKRCPDNHRVAGHGGGRLNPDFASLQVGRPFAVVVPVRDRLVIVELQVHNAVFSERRNAHAGLGIQANQPEAGRHIKNAFVHAFRPIRQPAPRKLSRGRAAALAFVFAVNPQQFSALWIHRDHRPPRSRCRVKNAVHHQRRSFQLVFRPVAEIVRLNAPGDLQIAEITGIDLVQRTIASARKIGGVRRPLVVLRMELRGYRRRPGKSPRNNQKQ